MNHRIAYIQTSLLCAALSLTATTLAAVQPGEVVIVASRDTQHVDSVSRHVKYGDLDLSKPANVSEFQKRVTQAAKQVCKELDDHYPTLPKRAEKCTKETLDSAMPEVNAIIAAGAKPH